jgi:hypothetical protein
MVSKRERERETISKYYLKPSIFINIEGFFYCEKLACLVMKNNFALVLSLRGRW